MVKRMINKMKNDNRLAAGIVATLWCVRRYNNKKNEKNNNPYRLTCHLLINRWQKLAAC